MILLRHEAEIIADDGSSSLSRTDIDAEDVKSSREGGEEEEKSETLFVVRGVAKIEKTFRQNAGLSFDGRLHELSPSLTSLRADFAGDAEKRTQLLVTGTLSNGGQR